MARIGVDMTPIMPGGENGGAKIFAVELLKAFQHAASQDQFIILTASWNHEELAVLDAPNMRRVCVLKKKNRSQSVSLSTNFPEQLSFLLLKIRQMLKRIFKKIRLNRHFSMALNGMDVLFCPFTAPTYYRTGIPIVSVVHDLQHKDYPHFFDAAEIRIRDEFLTDVREKATYIICISKFVQQSVIRHLKTDPNQTVCIYNSIHNRLKPSFSCHPSNILEDLGISDNHYMLYPANFWVHKNHQMLLVAFGMFVSRNPDEKTDLVFTGALEDTEADIKSYAKSMGLIDRVHFLGFLSHEKFEAVWRGCRFLIFPSLYEGFGIPVLEAMSMGKPVLCSNLTSLPEVAGDAALFFDPRKPMEMVDCIEKLLNSPDLEKNMIKRGLVHSKKFNLEKMTKHYMAILHSSLQSILPIKDSVSGLFGDGWAGNEMSFTYALTPDVRTVVVMFEAPENIPAKQVTIFLRRNGKKIKKFKINRASQITIQQSLPANQQGHFDFSIHPTFCPIDHGMGPDDRSLGLICCECSIITNGRKKKIY